MRLLLLACAAAALAAAPARAAVREAPAAPALEGASGPAAPGVPALPPLPATLEPAAAVPAPALQAFAAAPLPASSPLADVETAEASAPRAQAAAVGAAAARRAPTEALAEEQSVLFDGAAALEERAGPVPGAAAPPAGGLRLAPLFRRAPAHPALSDKAALILAERATRSAGTAATLAMPALSFLAFGLFGVAVFVTAFAFAKRARPRRPLTLPAERRQALLDRTQARLDALIAELGVPSWRAPALKLSNDWGRHNMTAAGTRMSGLSVISVGEDWALFTDEEMDGVLAHELGHIYRRDSAKTFSDARRPGNTLALAGAALAPLTALIAWAHAVDPQPVDGLERLLGGWAAGPHGGSLAVVIAVVSLGGAALLFLSSRLRERLADRFSARLAGPAGLIAFFQRLSLRPRTRGLRARQFLGLATHPTDRTRIRYLRKAPRA